MAQVKEELHRALLFRFRAALPPVDQDPSAYLFRRYSDYHAILEPLAHGVHIYFQEEIALAIPVDEGRSIHKGIWRARYHLAPPDTASCPAEIPTEPAEPAKSPQSCRLQKEKEQQRLIKGAINSAPRVGFLLVEDDIMEGMPDDDPRLRKISEELDGMELITFEGALEVEILDEKGFDRVVEAQEMEGYRSEVEGRYSAFWPWG